MPDLEKVQALVRSRKVLQIVERGLGSSLELS